MFPAGERRHSLSVRSDSGSSATSTGARTEDWPEYARWFAAIEPIGHREFAMLRARHPAATMGAAIPWSQKAAGITPEYRVIWTSNQERDFDVLGAIDPDGSRREVHLALRERNVPDLVSP